MTIKMTWPQYKRQECQLGGFVILLSPQETELLFLLLVRYPTPIMVSEIIEWVWPHPDFEPNTAENNCRHLIRQLRLKLGKFHVTGRTNFGYRLAQTPQEQHISIKDLKASRARFKMPA
jgi:DNA-binding response OmpR family regulator